VVELMEAMAEALFRQFRRLTASRNIANGLTIAGWRSGSKWPFLT
jgi:hypothetical protein